MSIHYVAGHNADQGEAFVWQIEDGLLHEDISYMLKEIFPDLRHMLNYAPEDAYIAEIHVANKIKFYNKIVEDYLLIYYPITETAPVNQYRDESGAYCHQSTTDVEIEVPLYEIRELIREHYPQVENVDAFVDNMLKIHANDTYWHNDYYGSSVTYAYIKIKKDADISRYL